MVGQDDDLVRAFDTGGDPLEHRQHPVDALQRLQRLPPVGPGVVGHLVVVHEVAEHHGYTAGHLCGDERDVEVAQQDVGQPAQRDVRATAADAGKDVVAALLAGLVHLFDHLADGEHQRAGESLRAGRERGVAVGPASGQAGLTDGEQAVRCVAGEDVADADPAVGEQATAVAEPPLDLGGVPRAVGDHETARGLVIPAEGGDMAGRAMQDAGLAGRGRRRHAGVPLDEAVRAGADPAAQRGQVPGRDRPPQQWRGQPVDLHDDDAWAVERAAVAATVAGDLPHDLADERFVAAGVGQPADDR